MRVAGDVQVVTRDFPFLHGGAGAPAFAVNHLLVGQDRLIHRIPVHHLGLAVRNAFFQHLQKQPLVPAVILWRARGNFAAPVDGQAHRLHLLFHVSNVLKRPLGWWHAVFQRRVFCRQTKRIPTHGHQHVEALHAQIARQHVVDGVVAHVAHVQLAAGVRQHGAGVKLRLGRVFHHTVGIAPIPQGLCPMRAGGLFDCVGEVLVLHGVLREA